MPQYPLYLTEYPNMHTSFPFSLKIETVETVIPHRHDFLELILVLEGSGFESVNGTEHRMEPGTLIFLLPYQFHTIQSDPGAPLRLFICNFDLELLFHSKNGELGLASMVLEDSAALPPYVQLKDREWIRIFEIFDDMMGEYISEERMRSVMIQSKLLEALVLFDRLRIRQHGAEIGPSGETVRHPGKASFWQIIHYVHKNYREEITLEQLAREYHYNASHLSELFKIRTGQNFVRFLQGLRIRHACGLLSSSDLPVSAIAYEVGFGSFQTFSRTFLKSKGLPPTVYRKQSRN